MALGDTDTFTADEPSQADYSAEGGPISDSSTATATAPPATSPGVMVRPVQQNQSSRPSLPQPNLDRAYHTMDFLQRNPQWLANPYTRHAAEAVLANSSKMIEMSIQLERVNSMADSTRNKNAFLKTKVNDLSKITPFIPSDDVDGQAELGRLNGMIGSEDFSLPDFSIGVARLQSQYSPKPGAESLTMSDGTVLQGYKDRFGNFHQSTIQNIEARNQAVADHIQQRGEVQDRLAKQRFGFQKDILDRKEFTSQINSEAKVRLKKMDQQFTDSQKEVDELRKAGVTDEDPRMLKAIGKQAILGIKQNDFLDTIRPEPKGTTTAPAETPSAPVGLPEGQRVKSRITGKMGTVKNGVVVPDPDQTE